MRALFVVLIPGLTYLSLWWNYVRVKEYRRQRYWEEREAQLEERLYRRRESRRWVDGDRVYGTTTNLYAMGEGS